MIKSLGVFLILVFLILSSQMGGFAYGFSIVFLSILALISGTIGFALFTAPIDIEQGAYQKIHEPLPQTNLSLCSQLEEVAQVVRRDGLLALEATRKDLKDPLLKLLLKKVMDGYSKADLLPLLRNQAIRRAELVRGVEVYILRVVSFLPTIGLIPSLFIMTEYLNQAKGSLAVNSLPTAFLPFLLALILQLLFQSWAERWFDELKEEVKLYFLILEEGISGIQEGQNADLIRDKLKARVSVSPKWTES